METNTILLSILVVLVLILLYKDINKQENITSDSGKTLSDEALQNIAKVYSDKDGIVTFNNVKITGKLDVSGNIIADGSGSNIKALTTNSIKNTGNYESSGNIIANGEGSNIRAFTTNYIRNTGHYDGASIRLTGNIGVSGKESYIGGFGTGYIDLQGEMNTPGGNTIGGADNYVHLNKRHKFYK
jgi:hypothetical protein